MWSFSKLNKKEMWVWGIREFQVDTGSSLSISVQAVEAHCYAIKIRSASGKASLKTDFGGCHGVRNGHKSQVLYQWWMQRTCLFWRIWTSSSGNLPFANKNQGLCTRVQKTEEGSSWWIGSPSRDSGTPPHGWSVKTQIRTCLSISVTALRCGSKKVWKYRIRHGVMQISAAGGVGRFQECFATQLALDRAKKYLFGINTASSCSCLLFPVVAVAQWKRDLHKIRWTRAACDIARVISLYAACFCIRRPASDSILQKHPPFV